MRQVLSSILVSMLFLSACSSAPKIPVMGESVIYDVDVVELSGLCLSADKSYLIACGDKGDVKTISFSGEVSDIWSQSADTEGVTVDPSTGDIYIAVERSQTVEGELLATYDVSEIENAESICVDRDRNCVWVGSDEDSPKLYRYSFEF